MAYDENLADRVRVSLARRRGVSEQKMFGGICFLLNGNMCCGINGSDLFLRLGHDGVTAALEQPHTRPCDLTKSIIKTVVIVSPAGHHSDDSLKMWIGHAVKFTRALPHKQIKNG